MNYEEARDYFATEARGNVEAIKTAIKALDDAHIFRWHDLVANTQDLPVTGSRVLRAIPDGESRCRYEVGCISGGEVAWRCFEPFDLAGAKHAEELNEAYDRGFEDGRASLRGGCSDCKYLDMDDAKVPCEGCRNNYTDKWERA